jgi:hypothetical protein
MRFTGYTTGPRARGEQTPRACSALADRARWPWQPLRRAVSQRWAGGHHSPVLGNAFACLIDELLSSLEGHSQNFADVPQRQALVV